MRIAVTGGTGFVGSHLAELLVSRGHEVTVLVRSPERMRWLRGLAVRVVYGTLDGVPRELVAGQEVLVHAAGLTRAPRRREFLRVNVEDSVRLLEAALAHSPRLRRFLYISSQAAMGPSPPGEPLEEDAPQRPISAYGASKSLAERALSQYGARVPITFVRPPWVYGPRDQDTFAYFRLADRGLRLVVRPESLFSIVHVANLVQGIALAAESPRAGGRAYFFTDGDGWTMEQLSLMMAEATRRGTVRIPVPVTVVAAVAAANELAAAVTGRPALIGWRKLGEAWHRCWLVSDRRAREELGYQPAVSTEQGMVETAAWYRREGWLKEHKP